LPCAFYAYAQLRRHWETAIAYLADSLTNADPAIRRRIAINLADHCYFLSPQYHPQEFQNPEGALAQFTARLYPALCQGLSDELATVRAACVNALRYIVANEHSLPELLLPSLRDTDASVRAQVTRALRHRQIQIPLQELQPYLHDARPVTRAAAISLIPDQLDGAVCDTLVAASVDPVMEVRHALLLRLDKIFTAVFTGNAPLPDDPRLIKVFGNFVHDNYPEVRDKAAECLQAWWDREMQRRYLLALHDGDTVVQEKALTMLANLWANGLRRYIEKLLGESDPAQRMQGTSFIHRLADSRHEYLVNRALQDDNSQVRLAAVEAVIQFDDASLLKSVTRYQQDPDPQVAARATYAVAQLRAQLSFSSLATLLRCEQYYTQRARAVQLVRFSSDSRRNDLLHEALRDENSRVRFKGNWGQT
jgi:HEAT repeat protein